MPLLSQQSLRMHWCICLLRLGRLHDWEPTALANCCIFLCNNYSELLISCSCQIPSILYENQLNLIKNLINIKLERADPLETKTTFRTTTKQE